MTLYSISSYKSKLEYNTTLESISKVSLAAKQGYIGRRVIEIISLKKRPLTLSKVSNRPKIRFPIFWGDTVRYKYKYNDKTARLERDRGYILNSIDFTSYKNEKPSFYNYSVECPMNLIEEKRKNENRKHRSNF